MSDRNDPGTPDEDRPFDTTPTVGPDVDTDSGSDIDSGTDLSMVHADDEYLDLLGGANLDDPDDVPDDQLSALLMSWRRDVEAEPIGDVVDQKLATVTVHAARVRRRRRPRLLVPVAAAAAVLAIAFAGVGLAARDAQPGDTLWALTKVLYSDHARSVEAAEAVRTDLREAEEALTEGRVSEAKSKLEDAHAALPTVSSEDGQKDLEKQHASLMAQLPGNPSDEASQPPAPNPTTAPDTGGGSGSDTAPDTKPTSPSTPPEDSTAPSPGTTTPPPPSTTTSQPGTSRSDSEDPVPGGEPASVGTGAETETEPAVPAAPAAPAE